MKRPAFWIVLALVSAGAVFVGIRYFPQAFSIVALDITMDRDAALARARTIMSRDALGPAGYRQAASFALDEEAQTFVELEGGGKNAFTRMLRDGLYSAYTWRVRQFREGETNETTIRFTPDGRPYGFVEKLEEEAPGPALDAAAARQIAESGATSRWNIDLSRFTLVEQGQERRTGNRVDHTFTYERPSPVVGEGRYRLRLVVSGDRLTEVTHFLRIPEAFSRRYASMRAANETIGVGSVVGMALLYVFGGIGVGLFVMLRRRWVLWRHAAFWGIAVALMQALAALNEFPLAWMAYDTALPRSTFLAQQVAFAITSFIGFSVFFALSFMAAETLSRRAFGGHPQLWRVWSGASPDERQRDSGRRDEVRVPGASVQILGRTVGGYLLVSVFFAYDVMLYLVTTKTLGWWSPSEALLHPDVLATYAPWLSAIANSFQAGFWEESLFRAVPLAGAALIGDRFGKRRLFLAIGFIVQALVFGAGHAPYPNQPSFARPVELIIPSIGFGLLYVYFGLLPGIILHFTFDVVWFALPIFLASAPGIWFQQLMVVLVTLVPLWIVLWRRAQAGRWVELSPDDRNAAWVPPAAVDRPAVAMNLPQGRLGKGASTVWLVGGVAGLVVCLVVPFILQKRRLSPFLVAREVAAERMRQALQQHGVTLGRQWHFMPVPEDGNSGAQEFVAETAGEPRRQELLGTYLATPRWRVRIATFEGDVADRAEEWRAFVTASGEVRNLQHVLPEGRAGASLDEAAARRLALAAVSQQLGLGAGQLKEVSARPAKLKARTDWTFTFVDTTVPPLPSGEPRITAAVAGDEVAGTGRFVYVPEEWQRRQRAAATRNLILQIFETFVFAGLLVTAAVIGILSWSRRRYTPRLFVAGAALMLIASIVKSVNGWPTVMASLTTAAPLQLQILGLIGIGLVGLTLSAVLVGLALGALPRRLTFSGDLPEPEALRLGIASGLFGAAISMLAGWLRTPVWARTTDVGPAGTLLPFVQAAVDPITRFLLTCAILVTALVLVDRLTAGWSRQRVLGIVTAAAIGFLAGGLPLGIHIGWWMAGGLLTGAALAVAVVTLLRFDPTIVPIALGTMMAVGALERSVSPAYRGALAGALGATLLLALVAWWWFRALRRARADLTARETVVQS